jgi:subtilisin family serine protease
VKRPGSILCALALVATFAAVPGYARASGNPFGVTVVRFAHGTSPAAMRAAVTTAGGTVVADLSRIDALAAVSSKGGFGARLKSTPTVTAAFQDAVVRSDRAPDAGKGGIAGLFDDSLGSSFPDPWHEATSFWGVTNPEGILQWDDNRMHAAAAWRTTKGDPSIRVAVLDSGIQWTHKELQQNFDAKDSEDLIPCQALSREFGEKALRDAGLWDCSAADNDGHGTWVASRIAGAVNGFASNGVAPNVKVASFKVLAAGFGGLPSWIVAGMLDACASHADLVNASIGGYLDPSNPSDAQDYLLFVDAASYCRSQGVPVFSAAGNDHVQIDRADLSLGGRDVHGAGVVSSGERGIAATLPGAPSLADSDLRGLLEVPAGVPGIVMVSSTANAIGAAPASVPLRWRSHVGARDQLAYYSNYGSRVDLAAPGGARRYEIPLYDGGAGDILYGGWGSLGALADGGDLCTDPVIGSPLTFACFNSRGDSFGWLQGTSMSAPNAVGVAALALSAKPDLRGRADALVARLESTANRTVTNWVGPTDPANLAPGLNGTPCATGYCHLEQSNPIPSAAAYGAGLVDAAQAVRP